jgi:hypothetical protein
LGIASKKINQKMKFYDEYNINIIRKIQENKKLQDIVKSKLIPDELLK